MSLIEEIDDELKDAMRARDAERRDTLRLILNALKNSQKELQRPLSEEEELQVLQRERKRRLEAAEAFRNGGREEQAQAEERELEHGRPRARDGRRDASDSGPRRRLTGQPDRPRKTGITREPEGLAG